METKFWQVSAVNPDLNIIKKAATIIREGGLVAFPTETVYGLGADGFNPEAVKNIFVAKGRPNDNPLIIHIAEDKEIFRLARQADKDPRVSQLISRFWPGPLTLVLAKQKTVPDEVTAGLDTVAIRMPQHPVALALIKACGAPLAAPSANRSGYPSPTTGQHVYADLGGRIEAILESGPTGVGVESTVLDLSTDAPVILRPGGVTREALVTVLGNVYLDPGLSDPRQTPKAPGMKYKHYSPHAEVILVQGARARVAAKIKELTFQYSAQGKKVGLLLTRETWANLGAGTESLPAFYRRDLGSAWRLEEIAQVIYSELRNCDLHGVEVILTETYQTEGIGAALMNRLLKSAGQQVIKA